MGPPSVRFCCANGRGGGGFRVRAEGDGGGLPAPGDAGKDVFVHISAARRSGLTGLADDQKVRYELSEGRDGRQLATDLELV
ncbi:cold shock CspA family protein [Hasllibacter halocynthiae]|uniref:Cold shock CspA family protein n=1 Tax=Hasllibacter halocynthiae TaxID=595589 RepID=A0A2T0X6S4_9RHOB|nr:cold shock domain-containing protein [Hasllibacter halocynthiae]PRY94648.1 cold shock CspA family protein [Hasllibacter halocynthiae]